VERRGEDSEDSSLCLFGREELNKVKEDRQRTETDKRKRRRDMWSRSRSRSNVVR